LTDTILFNDLLDYILPAGMSVNVFKQNLIENTINDYVNTKDDASSVTVQINSDVSTVPNHDNTSGIKPSDIGAGRIDNISVVPKN
jgi:D-alanyl-D-alanine carboxypeptidase